MKLCTVVPISQVVMVLSLQPKDMRSSLRVVYLSAFITCISYCYFCGLLIENDFQKPFFCIRQFLLVSYFTVHTICEIESLCF